MTTWVSDDYLPTITKYINLWKLTPDNRLSYISGPEERLQRDQIDSGLEFFDFWLRLVYSEMVQGILSIKLSMITGSHCGESQAESPGFWPGVPGPIYMCAIQ